MISLVDTKTLVSSAPLSFAKETDSIIIVIHILNQSIRHNEGVIVTLPANQIECSIYEPIEARLVYPNQEELEIKDGFITVPPVSIHSIVVLTLPKDQQPLTIILVNPSRELKCFAELVGITI